MNTDTNLINEDYPIEEDNPFILEEPNEEIIYKKEEINNDENE